MPASDYQYWLGKDTEDLKWVGKRGIVRRDADDKTTGKAKFGSDIELPGMLHARIMMCPHAHARIKSMDTSEAEKLPGVRAVLRYDDPSVYQKLLHPWDPEIMMNFFTRWMCEPRYMLGPEAWYEGAPLGVAIAADDLDIADEAMDLVKVEWEVRDFVIDYEKALEPGATRVFDHLTSYNPNSTYFMRFGWSCAPDVEEITQKPGWEGVENANNIKLETEFKLKGSDLDKGFAEADQTIDFSFKRTEVIGFGPETLSSVARWTDNGMLEVWQGGENIINAGIYATLLGIDKSRILTHMTYAGGQFGGWDAGYGNQSSQIPVAALLSKMTNQPVRLAYQRKDDQYGEMDEAKCTVKVGFKNDGTITAVQIRTIGANTIDMSLYPDTTGGGHFIESTRIPNMGGLATCAFVNKHGFGPSRCEQQINAHVKQQVFSRVAAALGTDEASIALINDGQDGLPIEDFSAYKIENKMPDIDSYKTVIPLAKDMISFENKFHAPGVKTLPNGKLHGMCLAPNHEFSNGGTISARSFTYAVNLCVDNGKVFISAQRPDCGLDGRTGYSRMVAEETGMNLDDVLYLRSEEEPKTQPAASLDGGGGSVMFTIQSWAIVIVSRVLKGKMLSAAAAFLGTEAEELDIVDSMVVFKNDPSNATPIAQISSLQGLVAQTREGDWESLNLPAQPTGGGGSSLAGGGAFISRSINILEVEVDQETGQVEMTNAVAVNDVGIPIGPETVEGQMYGAAIMGYSTGASEEVIYDPGTGVRLNPNFLDYKISTILDAPEIDYQMVTSRMGYGAYGSCGVGEDNTTFGSPMIIPAIYNATGVWVDTYPPTPERVLKALGKA